jgi:large subunit ribosomal protein L10
MKRALKNCTEKPEIQKMIEYLEGSIIFLLTDINPFKLALTFQKEKIKTTAKARDVAAFDVVVPSGNTGQPPGPVISHFNAVGLPTRIESGSVWITKDTLVCKKGDEISQSLAGILSKLGIKPVEVELKIIVVYDNGLVIPREQLYVDISKTKQNIEAAHVAAYALSLSIVYPTLENIKSLIQVAWLNAYNLSVNASIPTTETIVDLIRKANMETLCLSSLLDSLESPSK